MKSSVTDSGEIPLADGRKLKFRLDTKGFFPKKIREELESVISESIVTFMRECRYSYDQMVSNASTLTDLLEMETDEIASHYSDEIRYCHITQPDVLKWVMEVHLEQAVAACRVMLQITVSEKDA